MELNRWGALTAAGICTLFIASLFVDRLPEFDGRIIFFTEVGLAIFLVFLVFRNSQRSDRAVEYQLGEVRSMLARSENSKRIRQITANRALRSDISAIVGACSALIKMCEQTSGMSQLEWEQLKTNVITLRTKIEETVDKMGHELADAEYLDDRTYDDLAVAVDQPGEPSIFNDDEKTVDTDRYQYIHDMLLPLRSRLDRRLNPREEWHSEQPSVKAEGPPDRFEIRLDRNVYPPNGTINARVVSNDPFPIGKIVITILDENFATLAKKTEKIPVTSHGIPSENTLEVDIKLKGVAVGGEYIARAICGGLSSESTFVVDQIPPDIETDKSVYMIDDDMTTTVIDLTADTNTVKKEYIGNTKKSRLLIESPHGKLDYYRLEETGPSTGTFQGTIRCLGVRSDGSVRGTMVDDVYVDKTQGKGPEDGVIKCGPDQLVQIRYENESGVDTAAVFIGWIDPVIELGRAEYTCLDRVAIAVVSPDHTSGVEDGPAAIGDDSSECWLSVSTGKGKLDGYRLVETGPGTSTFVGTVSLTGLDSMAGRKALDATAYGKTGGMGPNDGMLACGPDDELKVSFESAFAKTVHHAVPVRWHIGEIHFSKPAYLPGEEIVVNVMDRDVNLDPNHPDRLLVRAWSSSDRNGISVPVVETDSDSGIFVGQFRTDTGQSLQDKHLLHAADGDSIVAEYIDETLPSPYGSNDSVKISSSATVTTKAGPADPLARLLLDDLRVWDEKTGSNTFVAGEKTQIAIRVKNPGLEITFDAILQVVDSGGAASTPQYLSLNAGPGGYASHAFTWVPHRPGIYSITVFLGRLDDAVAYSPPSIRRVEVAGSPAGAALPEDRWGGRQSIASGGKRGGGLAVHDQKGSAPYSSGATDRGRQNK